MFRSWFFYLVEDKSHRGVKKKNFGEIIFPKHSLFGARTICGCILYMHTACFVAGNTATGFMG